MKWEDAFIKYPNIIKRSKEGNLELYADHHTLSSLRSCEGYFKESVINRLGKGGSGTRAWYLEFGIWFHGALEIFYNAAQCNTPLTCAQWVDYGTQLWADMQMEDLKFTTQYKTLGGIAGAISLLVDYFLVYGEGRDILKIIGTELPFGYDKEVPLGRLIIGDTDKLPEEINCFYTGRIDDIVDYQGDICPMDTKTTSNFSGMESTQFKPHEGMCGYVFALNHLVKDNFPDYKKSINRVIINHVSVKSCLNRLNRFKRTPVTFTPNDLEQWRLRQLVSFKKMYELIIEEREADWNTGGGCRNFNSDCVYKSLHGVDIVNREMVIKSQYIVKPEWNPYMPPSKEEGKKD